MVVAEDAGDGVHKNAFAIGTISVEEEHCVLGRHPGERVTGHPCEVRLQFFVPVRHAIEELRQQWGWARGIRSNCSDLGHVVLGAMIAALAGAQVDDAAGRIEQPRVGVPLIDRRRQSGSSPARLTTAARVFALAMLLASRSLFTPLEASRQSLRASDHVSRVSSTVHCFPSKLNHLFHAET